MAEQFSNNPSTTLNGAINSAVTSIVVAAATGFSTSANYRIIVDSEIMNVTAGAGTTTWTVARGQEGTAAASHSSGATVKQIFTKAAIDAAFGRLDVSSIYTANQLFKSGIPWFDVRSFGAVGDGSNNDTGAINNALAAVPSTGGMVYMPAGRYKITSSLLIQNDNTTLFGAGAGLYSGGSQPGVGTRIECASGITTAAILVQGAANTTPVYGTILRDFLVDGMNVGSAVDGILFRSNRAYIENVSVMRATGTGIVVRGYAGWATYDTRLHACMSADNGSHGYKFDTRAEDLHLTECLAWGNSGDGWYVDAASEQMTNCHAYDNDGCGVRFVGGTRSKMATWKIEGNRGGVICDASASQINITGCGFKDNARDNHNLYDNIMIAGTSGCSGWNITGNTFNTTIGTKVRYAVNLANTNATNAVICDNNFGDAVAATAAVNNGGSTSTGFKCFVRNNMGWTTENNGTATVLSGTTSIAVSHGLSKTPNSRDIQVTPTNNLGSATKFWISSVGASTFTINVDVNPGASTATFVWQAEILYGT